MGWAAAWVEKRVSPVEMTIHCLVEEKQPRENHGNGGLNDPGY
jgi:hypothetical protein